MIFPDAIASASINCESLALVVSASSAAALVATFVSFSAGCSAERFATVTSSLVASSKDFSSVSGSSAAVTLTTIYKVPVVPSAYVTTTSSVITWPATALASIVTEFSDNVAPISAKVTTLPSLSVNVTASNDNTSPTLPSLLKV